MRMLSLDEVRLEIDGLAATIGAEGHSSLPTYGKSEQPGRPHIEVSPKGYHLVVAERGEVYERFTTDNLDALLERVFESVTFSLASDYELAKRKPTEDPRRQLFDRQVELLEKLDPAWARREAARHGKILQRHPFEDLIEARLSLLKKLMAEGLPRDEAEKVAHREFPPPSRQTRSARGA